MDLVEVKEDDLRERFALAFELQPSMTGDEFFQILKAKNFNEREAVAHVHDMSQKEKLVIEISDDDEEYIIHHRQKYRSRATRRSEDVNNQQESDEEAYWNADYEPDVNVTGSDLSDDESERSLDDVEGSLSDDEEEGLLDDEEEESSDDKDERSSDEDAQDNSLISGSRRNAEKTPKQRHVPPPKKKKVRSKTKKSDIPPTTVTKWIRRLVGGLYVRTMVVCDGEQALRDKVVHDIATGEGDDMDALINITGDPEARRAGWSGRARTKRVQISGRRLWRVDKNAGYEAATVDGLKIAPNDFVVVRPGTDEGRAKRGKRTSTKGVSVETAAEIWFARVEYIFTDADKTISAHVRWFSHGGDTILGETAGPKELFLIDRCDDIPISSIAGKINVDYVGRDDNTGNDGVGVVEDRESFLKQNSYFYRLCYDEAGESFKEVPLHDRQVLDSEDLETRTCPCCTNYDREQASKSTKTFGRPNAKGSVQKMSHLGMEYKIDDFVYITPEFSDEPYIIGQVTAINPTSSKTIYDKIQIEVREFRRHDRLLTKYLDEFENRGPHSRRDNRKLYQTDQVLKLSAKERLAGKCFVQHLNHIGNLDKYKDFDANNFYVGLHLPKGKKECLENLIPLPSYNFTPASDEAKLADRMSHMEAFIKTKRKLKSLDIFSGAGGLTLGMHESQAVDTCWGIEFDAAASKTFKRNFPSARIYNHDANVLLRRAIEEHDGENAAPLFDLSGKTLPPMPRVGEVEFIYGGPPCQDFSGCNRFVKANSIKNSLLSTYLSYVDHYRPKYFLLENVTGLLKHRLGSTQAKKHTVVGGIQRGSVKFILRALTSLGYQCQFSVIQADSQGTPQKRGRVIFWGSQPGHELPNFPEPTHVSRALHYRDNMRHKNPGAPHQPVSMGDSISDLAAFDWAMQIEKESVDKKKERESRRENIKQIDVDKREKRLGANIQHYVGAPVSEYQRQIRRGVNGTGITNHFTIRFDDSTMERVIKIPLRPGANHLDLLPEEDVTFLRDPAGSAPRYKYYPLRYCRLDYEEGFETCLTDVNPCSRNGKVLHPSQNRILTVREYARAMGFLDTFTWDPYTQTPRDMYRQIGNAVAIPVAHALGKELLKVMIRRWEQGSDEKTVSHDSGDPQEVMEDVKSELQQDEDDDFFEMASNSEILSADQISKYAKSKSTTYVDLLSDTDDEMELD